MTNYDLVANMLGMPNIGGMNETPDIPLLQDRLTWARERLGLTQKEVADRVPIAPPTYNDLESGKSKKSAYIVQLAEILNVNPRWLALNKGTYLTMNISDAPLDKSESAKYDQPAPIYQWSEIERTISAGSRMNDLFRYEYHGDAMDGTKGPHIPAGSILHVDPTIKPKPGHVILGRVDGHQIIGVLSVTNGRTYARPSSQQFTAEDMTNGQIIGVVTSVTAPMPMP